MDKLTRQGLTAFREGTGSRTQEVLGAHYQKKNGVDGVTFRTWAPSADHVSVVGDFNRWQADKTPMKYLEEFGVWSVFVPGLRPSALYKFAVRHRGETRLKADPYALCCERGGGHASALPETAAFRWADKRWLNGRLKRNHPQSPLNIYEVHLGSWRRGPEGEVLDYQRLAEELAAYAVDMGYTHVELLPVTEYPFGGSWGYQVSGYFSPTPPDGAPRDFKQPANLLHKAGLGVILDWVPAHFPKDDFGLFEYDGTPCYEYGDPHRSEHKGWGTRVFDYGKPQVQSFLLSSALYWIEEYHIDGLRLDAVASMLYLDYDRDVWSPNIHGGKEHLEAVEFIRKLNQTVKQQHPDVLMIAEESTAWPMVTKPVQAGGLGFDFKWNMGWMNDTLSYAALDPIYRAYNHDKLTFSMMYAFSERYILPISHDEVVHEKKSLLSKMPGPYEQQFAGTRVLLGYMMSHPGKKLLFMGCEFGQFTEWDHQKELDWMLLEYPAHRTLQDYVRELNRLYLSQPPLWQVEDSWEGFRWVIPDDAEQNILVFKRMDDNNKELYVVCNFAPVERTDYRFGVSPAGSYSVLLHSDEARFGGSGYRFPPELSCEEIPSHDMDHSIALHIPALSVTWLRANNKRAVSGKVLSKDAERL